MIHTKKIYLWVFVLSEVFLANRCLCQDWPHWRGPHRNDLVLERSGWKAGRWLPGRPKWAVQLGVGSSSPIVIGNDVYNFGWRTGKETVSCLNATTGKKRWTMSYDAPRYGRHATGDQGLYSGPSSTPEYDKETKSLYTLGNDGDLRALDVSGKQPKIKWKLNLYDRYNAPQRPRVGRSGRRDYGYTSSPLIVGGTVIVEVGASIGTLIGFDKRTGMEVWRSAAKDPAGHNGGPVPITVDGVRCVALHHFNGLLVARIDKGNEGKTVAEYPWRTRFANNVASPTVHNNSILLTSSYNQNRIVRLDISLSRVKKVWEQREASKVCSPVVYKGSVYWAWNQLVCLDFKTGQLRWKGGRYGDAGSCIATADDRLIVWANRGDLTLVDTAIRSPDRYNEKSNRTRIGKGDAWPHVVLSGRHLLCKDRTGYLVCFDLD